MSSVMIVIRKSMTISPIEPHNTQGTIQVVRNFDASYVRYVFHKRENAKMNASLNLEIALPIFSERKKS